MWSTLRNKGLPALRQQLGGAQLYHGRPLPSALPFSARKGVIAAAKRKSGPRSSRSTTDEPAEQNNGNQPRAAAYRREKVHINNQNYTVRNLLLLIKEKTLNLEPEYQRDFVWDPKRCMGLLMTVYEGLVIPPIILHERTNADGKLVYEVVDGKQRLATLWTFIEGDNTLFPKAPVMFELDKEEDDLYAVLNGKTFAMLDDEEKKYFNQFDVHVQLILENTPLEKVFRIYEGINSGGMGHSKQQMRRAAFYGPYVELLGELTKSDKGKKYKQLAEVTEKEETEQQLEELILRFFALRRAGIDGSGRRFRVPMKNFLNSELQMEGPGGRKVVKALTEKENKGMTHTFEKTVELMDTLGLKEVAEQELGGKIRSPRKVTPAWDITLVGLSRALDRNDNIGVYECNAAAMRQNYRSLLGCPEWKGISNTLSHTSLVKRLDLFLDKVVKPALKGDYTQ